MDEAKRIKEIETEVKELRLLVAKQQALIEYYIEQLRLSKRRQFGASSEQIDTDEFRQMNLFNEVESEADTSLPEPKIEEITYKRKKRKGKRTEDISGLPIERIDYEMPEELRVCPDCGDRLTDIGATIRSELKIIPAQAVVVEHATHAYKCRECAENSDSTPIIRAQSPTPLISGSLASPSAVAHIVNQKYANGMPLYRIEHDLKMNGINLSRQTMSNWVMYCAENLLKALYTLLVTIMLTEFVLHADETTLQVLHEPGKPAVSKSYEWVYRTSACAKHPIVIYEYKRSRSGYHAKEFLKEFTGFLHTDGYQAYHDLPGVISVGCWAHARRYFVNLYKTLPKDTRDNSDAARGIAFIDRLFDFEREFADLSPRERYEKRLEKSKPVAEAFFAWTSALGALPQSLLGKAVNYALSQREYLMNVFLDGRLELSNNRCENSVRPFVRGRRAWLFSNTPDGAEASSIMFSIVETAKENGLRPFAYIKFLLETLPTTTTSGLASLLPWSDSLPDYCRLPSSVKA